jgi:hypothetical protein
LNIPATFTGHIQDAGFLPLLGKTLQAIVAALLR